MHSLTHFLVMRLFGTKRVVAESALVVGSFLLLLGLMPYVLQRAFLYLMGGAALVGALAVMYLIYFIIPGLLVGLIGLAALALLVILFLRGCIHVAIRYLNWALRKYYLAKEDVHLNSLFAS